MLYYIKTTAMTVKQPTMIHQLQNKTKKKKSMFGKL